MLLIFYLFFKHMFFNFGTSDSHITDMNVEQSSSSLTNH